MPRSVPEWPYPTISLGPFAGSCRIQPLEGRARWAVPVAMSSGEAVSRGTLSLRPFDGDSEVRWRLPLRELTRPFARLDRGLAGQRHADSFRTAAAATLRELQTPLLVVPDPEGGAARPRSLVELHGALPPEFAWQAPRILVSGLWADHLLRHVLTRDARSELQALARLANKLPGLPFRGRQLKKALSCAQRKASDAPGFLRASGIHFGAWPLLELYFGLTWALLRQTTLGRAVHAARACDTADRPRTLLDQLCAKALQAFNLRPGEEALVAEPIEGLRVVARDRGGVGAPLRWRTTFVAENQKGLERLRKAARYPGVEAVEWKGAR